MNGTLRFAIIGLALIAVGLAYFRSQPLDVVPIGNAVRQDDFTYTITRVVKERDAETVSYVVTIRVENDAKRVDYQWSDDTVFVTDAAGRHYHAIVSNTSTAVDRAPIPPSASAEYDLTFRLPADAKNPMLRYWNGILMGDVFDGVAYSRTAVAL